MNTPNKLSLGRIVLIIPMITLLLMPVTDFDTINFGDSIKMPMNYFIAAIIFIVASSTDWLDGYLARKYNQVTTFGKFIDPIADKLLVNSVIIIFAFNNLIPLWATLVIVLRDTLVDSVRMFLSSQNIVVAANMWGKLKTVAQMIAIPLIFLMNTNTVDGLTEMQQHLVWIPLYIATFFSALSGIIYFAQGWPHIAKSK